MVGDIGAHYILAYTSSAIHWSNALSEFFVVKAPLFLSEEEKVRLFSISRSDWVNRLFSPVSSAIRAGQAIEGRHLIVVFCDDLAIGV